MTFAEAAKRFVTRSLDFRGRASRSEFWWGFLLVMLLTFLASTVDFVMRIKMGIIPEGAIQAIHYTARLAFPSVVGTVEWLDKAFLSDNVRVFSIQGLMKAVLLIPTLSLYVRRFHDVDRSAVWIASLDVIRLCALPPYFLTMSRPLYHKVVHLQGPNGILIALFELAVSIAMIVWLFRKGTEGANHYGEGCPVGRRPVPRIPKPPSSSLDDGMRGFGELTPTETRPGPRRPRVLDTGNSPAARGRDTRRG